MNFIVIVSFFEYEFIICGDVCTPKSFVGESQSTKLFFFIISFFTVLYHYFYNTCLLFVDQLFNTKRVLNKLMDVIN